MSTNGHRFRPSRRKYNETLRTIVSAEVGHNPHPGQYLALQRAFPSIQVGPAPGIEVQGRRAGAVERIADKDVPGRGHLRAGETGEQQESEGYKSEFAH